LEISGVAYGRQTSPAREIDTSGAGRRLNRRVSLITASDVGDDRSFAERNDNQRRRETSALKMLWLSGCQHFAVKYTFW
jgi:hypothetical protein